MLATSVSFTLRLLIQTNDFVGICQQHDVYPNSTHIGWPKNYALLIQVGVLNVNVKKYYWLLYVHIQITSELASNIEIYEKLSQLYMKRVIRKMEFDCIIPFLHLGQSKFVMRCLQDENIVRD